MIVNLDFGWTEVELVVVSGRSGERGMSVASDRGVTSYRGSLGHVLEDNSSLSVPGLLLSGPQSLKRNFDRHLQFIHIQALLGARRHVRNTLTLHAAVSHRPR